MQIRTIDIGNNPSPLSDPVAFSTLAANPNDTTPPTVPADVFANSFWDLEMEVSWAQSPTTSMRRRISAMMCSERAAGGFVFGSGDPRIVYGDFGENLIEVFATDTAGNTSAAGDDDDLLVIGESGRRQPQSMTLARSARPLELAEPALPENLSTARAAPVGCGLSIQVASVKNSA